MSENKGSVMEFYVSTKGDDENQGTKEKPFKSIIGARNAIRMINSNMKGDIIVYIRGGIYEIDETIEFDSRDSGLHGYNINSSVPKPAKPAIPYLYILCSIKNNCRRSFHKI
jgi:hypothetical protein